jgi:di/tricarboxylate transporter
MSSHAIAAIILLIVFVIGTVRPVNLGALALAAAFLAGPAVLGVPVEDVLAGFPANLFLLVLGVTYLFAIATVNGTVEWIVGRCTRLVGSRRPLLPIVLFAVSAVPTSLGALGPAAVAMLAPIALRLGQRYEVPVRLTALMVLFGATAGNFSPLNPLGAIVDGTMTRAGLASSPLYLYLVSFAFNALIGVAVYLFAGGTALLRDHRATPADRSAVPARETVPAGAGQPRPGNTRTPPGPAGDTPDADRNPDEPVLTPVRLLTLAFLAGVAVLALGFRFDVGICALVAAVVLTLVTPQSSAGALKLVAWNIILLICGIVTYVEVMEHAGTLDALGSSLALIGTPLAAAVLICAVGGLTSAFASSAGIIGAMVPLLVPLLAGTGANPIPIVAALAICVTIVDAAPFSSVGALVLTNTPESERRQVHVALLRWSAAMVLVGPIVTGAVLILPATGI